MSLITSSSTVQRLIMGAMVVGAVGALTLGAIYQDDDRLNDPSVIGGGASAPTSDGGSGDSDGGGGGETQDAGAGAGSTGADGEGAPGGGGRPADDGGSAEPGGPIEAWLPRSGAASACREEVGVDLIPGYGAILTINGIELAPEELNVNLDKAGEITDEITASRSIGHYTFRPDEDCPDGTYLRPTDNVLKACVYRLSDPTQRCVRQDQRTFDAI